MLKLEQLSWSRSCSWFSHLTCQTWDSNAWVPAVAVVTEAAPLIVGEPRCWCKRTTRTETREPSSCSNSATRTCWLCLPSRSSTLAVFQSCTPPLPSFSSSPTGWTSVCSYAAIENQSNLTTTWPSAPLDTSSTFSWGTSLDSSWCMVWHPSCKPTYSNNLFQPRLAWLNKSNSVHIHTTSGCLPWLSDYTSFGSFSSGRLTKYVVTTVQAPLKSTNLTARTFRRISMSASNMLLWGTNYTQRLLICATLEGCMKKAIITRRICHLRNLDCISQVWKIGGKGSSIQLTSSSIRPSRAIKKQRQQQTRLSYLMMKIRKILSLTSKCKVRFNRMIFCKMTNMAASMSSRVYSIKKSLTIQITCSHQEVTIEPESVNDMS